MVRTRQSSSSADAEAEVAPAAGSRRAGGRPQDGRRKRTRIQEAGVATEPADERAADAAPAPASETPGRAGPAETDDEAEASSHPGTAVGRARGGDDARSRTCPYLDTIDRHVLDFDFEKVCTVSLSNLNVYACLVCGRYFQGRGKQSHAYVHALEVGHHIFINLDTLRVYCLPDNYEVIDSSLDDIRFVLRPTYTPEQIRAIEQNARPSRALDGQTYVPGVVGLNNIKANDYVNVVMQALAHVGPFRDFFLDPANYAGSTNALVCSTGELMRKLWNARNFKSHVSPHELLQAVSTASRKRFGITQQGDPVDFLTWYLNALHRALGGTPAPASSIVYRTFQGGMIVRTRKIPLSEEEQKLLDEEARAAGLVPLARPDASSSEYAPRSEPATFLYLSLDIPPAPLYKDGYARNIIPQVPITALLSKFDDVTEKTSKTSRDLFGKRYALTRLPPVLIVCYSRFTRNNFFVEKNRTIVNFPMRGLDVGEYVVPEARAWPANRCSTRYNLIANICHDGEPGAGHGTYRVHVPHKATGTWYEVQDLHVRDVLPEMIALSEAYIQIYERDDAAGSVNT